MMCADFLTSASASNSSSRDELTAMMFLSGRSISWEMVELYKPKIFTSDFSFSEA
jgi:hypothetical protein